MFKEESLLGFPLFLLHPPQETTNLDIKIIYQNKK